MTHHEDENFLVAFNFSLINHWGGKKKEKSAVALQQQDELRFESWKWWGAWTVAEKYRKRSGESTKMCWARLAEPSACCGGGHGGSGGCSSGSSSLVHWTPARHACG